MPLNNPIKTDRSYTKTAPHKPSGQNMDVAMMIFHFPLKFDWNMLPKVLTICRKLTFINCIPII